MRICSKFIALPLFVLATFGANAQRLQFETLDAAVIDARLREVPKKDSEREPRLKELLLEAGCAPANLSEEPVKGYHDPNVICVLPGELPSEIVVGAHFDHVSIGEGVVDNWSGATLLPDLLQSIRTLPRHHTFVFIGFTAEERGLVGSNFYVKHLPPEQLKDIDAMINIDSVGMTTTKVWLSHSDPKLVSILAQVAASMELPVAGVNVERVGSADSEPFRNHKIPAITFHSATQENFRVLHSKDDTIRAISLPDYFNTYKLLSAYLAACDKMLPPSPPAPMAPVEKK